MHFKQVRSNQQDMNIANFDKGQFSISFNIKQSKLYKIIKINTI